MSANPVREQSESSHGPASHDQEEHKERSVSIAQFSVDRPVAVTMRIAALVLLGAICLTKLPVGLLPNVSLPTVS